MKEIFDINLLSIIILSLLSIIGIKCNLNKYYRMSILLFSLIFIGFYLKECICPIGAFQYLAIDFKNAIFLENLNFLLMFIIPIIFTIFFGRIYCGYICPMGAYQEFLFKIGGKLKLNKGNTAFGRFGFLVYLKYFFMISIIVFSIITGVAVFCNFDPFFALFNFNGSKLAFILLGITSILSLFGSRVWCRIVCPYGALLSLISFGASFISRKTKLKFGAPYINKTCKSCQLCKKKCIVGAIENNTIDPSECISCGLCKNLCKFNCIK